MIQKQIWIEWTRVGLPYLTNAGKKTSPLLNNHIHIDLTSKMNVSFPLFRGKTNEFSCPIQAVDSPRWLPIDLHNRSLPRFTNRKSVFSFFIYFIIVTISQGIMTVCTPRDYLCLTRKSWMANTLLPTLSGWRAIRSKDDNDCEKLRFN